VRARDTKGYSMLLEAHDDIGALFSDTDLLDDLHETANALDTCFPGTPAAVRTRALLNRVQAVRIELRREWEVLGPCWYKFGYQFENNWRCPDIAEAPGIADAVAAVD
jgi:hypothetical protein